MNASAAHVRKIILPSGFRKEARRTLKAPCGSPLANAFLETENSQSVNWVGTNTHVYVDVNSRGVARIRAKLAELGQ